MTVESAYLLAFIETQWHALGSEPLFTAFWLGGIVTSNRSSCVSEISSISKSGKEKRRLIVPQFFIFFRLGYFFNLVEMLKIFMHKRSYFISICLTQLHYELSFEIWWALAFHFFKIVKYNIFEPSICFHRTPFCSKHGSVHPL